MRLRWVVCIRHSACASAVFWNPLIGTAWALGEFPLVAKQGVEVAVVPCRWGGRPCALQAAGDGVNAFAAAEGALPAEALLFDAGAFWLCTFVVFRRRAVGFSEGVSASTQCHGFVVVHRHAKECFTDIACRSDWVWVAVWSLWIDVDQTHLYSCEGLL